MQEELQFLAYNLPFYCLKTFLNKKNMVCKRGKFILVEYFLICFRSLNSIPVHVGCKFSLKKQGFLFGFLIRNMFVFCFKRNVKRIEIMECAMYAPHIIIIIKWCSFTYGKFRLYPSSHLVFNFHNFNIQCFSIPFTGNSLCKLAGPILTSGL